METIWIKGVQLILSLSILVFIHELGHFFWSRLFKVKVEKFYLFFDTEKFALIRFTPAGRPQLPAMINVTIPGGDTEYGIGWIPLGGYCKIAGMVDESMDKEQLAQEPKPWEFRTQTAGKRFMIMVGGVLNNMLLAIFIYICMAWYWGKDVVYMRDIEPGMTYSAYAHEVGFQEGDVIWEVAGEKADITNFRNELLMGSSITIKRGEELVSIQVPDTIGQFFLGHPEELASFATAKVPMVVDDVVLGDEDYQPAINADVFNAIKEERKVVADTDGGTKSFDRFENISSDSLGDTRPVDSLKDIDITVEPNDGSYDLRRFE